MFCTRKKSAFSIERMMMQRCIRAQLAYSPLFWRFPEKLVRLGHGATPQFATNSARVTADIYLPTYIALHRNTQIHEHTNTQKYKYTILQIHKFKNTQIAPACHLSAYTLILHCTAQREGHIFKEYWWRLGQIRKYRGTAQDFCWWDTGMSQPGECR